MPHRCSARGCNGNARKPYESILHFFRFPSDPERCRMWLKNCGREDLSHKKPEDLNRTYRVCSLHFEKSQFTNCSYERLMHTAVPTHIDDPRQPDWSIPGSYGSMQPCQTATVKIGRSDRPVCLQFVQGGVAEVKDYHSTFEIGSLSDDTKEEDRYDCDCPTQIQTDHCYSTLGTLQHDVNYFTDVNMTLDLYSNTDCDTNVANEQTLSLSEGAYSTIDKSTQCDLSTNDSKLEELKRKLRAARCRISKLKKQLRCEVTRRRCSTVDALLDAAEPYLTRKQLEVLSGQIHAKQRKLVKQKEMCLSG